MKTTAIIFALTILSIIFSCKEIKTEETVVAPISTFELPFPKSNKQLSQILGEKLTIRTGSDTLDLKIVSNKAENFIINIKSGDTLFFGSVCKYRNLYYLSEKLNDTSYYISAFKIDGKLIFGLTDRLSQFYRVDEIIQKGYNKKLLKYINSDTSSIRLRPDKRELKNLFTAITNNIVPDTILKYDENRSGFKNVDREEKSINVQETRKDYALKAYPNPATEFINIEFEYKENSSFQLVDFNGKIVLNGTLNNLINRIDVSNQKSGIYILTVTKIEKNERKTVKIIIK